MSASTLVMRLAVLLALAQPACSGGSPPAPARPVAAPSAPKQLVQAIPASATYVGSLACRPCHAKVYERWKKTPMANVVRDPRTDASAILPDLSKPDPLVTFTRNDVALVYGQIWKQRYFTRAGNDYFPQSAQWDVKNARWRPYFVKDGTDWWVKHYPPDNKRRPTGPLCDGCHSVNYDIRTKTVTEWNVGCERCHGPGSAHVKNPVGSNTINPARLDYVQANDVCIQCHSQGRPLVNPVLGQHYDWPVGFRVGLRLQDYWQLETPHLGKTSFEHFADGTAHKNRMQGNDYVQSLMYQRGVTCFDCHDAHGSKHPGSLLESSARMCLRCHAPGSSTGPRGKTFEAHTHHKPGSPGAECVGCHMPAVAQTIADINVRSHTFRFVPPAMTTRHSMPNACNLCHRDKSIEWATSQLRAWPERSPWRH